VRNTWGVGSDLDLIAIVRDSNERFDRRAVRWDLTGLPVPADLMVYTEAEWAAMKTRRARFVRVVEAEAYWLYDGAADDTSEASTPHRRNDGTVL
jgi:hypothetical protein